MPFLDYTRLGVPHPTSKPEEIRFDCPFCEDSQAHLYLNSKKRVWNCFKCGQSGRTNYITSHMDQIHLAEVEKFQKETEFVPLKLPPAYKYYYTESSKKYLQSRGVYESDCRRHRIYCAAPNTLYFGRLIIPSNARGGFCTYFAARSYTKLHWPKYLNPSNPRTSLYLSPASEYESRFPRLWTDDELMLVEGPFDFIKASRHGPTAALLGKQLSNEQAKQIVSIYSMCYIMLDQGTVESLAAIKIRDMLAPHIDVQILRCPRKDPGEMSPQDFVGVF